MTNVILVAWAVGLIIWLVGSRIRLRRKSKRQSFLFPPKLSRLSFKPASGPEPMERIKPNHSPRANCEARTVKDIIEPAKSIFNNVSVKAALDEMQARAIDSSPVIDQRGELLGTLSKNNMNRSVGGLGHDPKTAPVEAYIETNSTDCFDDQTVAEAERIMLNAGVGEVPVVTREKLLVGTINIDAVAQAKSLPVRVAVA